MKLFNVISRVLIISFLASWTVYADDEEQMKTVIYPVTFGEPRALENIAVNIVHEDGHVLLDEERNRLVIVTTESKHMELKHILEPSEPVPANIQIDVQMNRSGSSFQREASVRGSGTVIFESGQKPYASGTLIPKLENSRTVSTRSIGQQLLVGNGRYGSLRVGERVPYITWIMDYGWKYGGIEQRVEWEDVGSFLTVKPTIMADGSTIRIQVTPELRGRVNGNSYRTAFTELATEIVAYNGQAVQIGGFGSHEGFYERFLVGYNDRGSEETLTINLTPTIRRPQSSPNQP